MNITVQPPRDGAIIDPRSGQLSFSWRTHFDTVATQVQRFETAATNAESLAPAATLADVIAAFNALVADMKGNG